MVATPIGNLDDITVRAVDVLKSVGIVAAEDTRRSAVLLAHIGARPERLLSMHDHNEGERTEQLMSMLQQGHNVAVISDAGTPLISDPGFELVRRANELGVGVIPIPGPSALTSVLSVSPIPIERFLFEGFLPSRAAARRKRLTELCSSSVAVVFFEAARRMREMLVDASEIAGPTRPILLAKELTKLHERVECGSIADLTTRLGGGDFFEHGEFVCVLGPAETRRTIDDAAIDALMDALCAELPPAQAARIAARATGRSKGELYDRAVKAERS
ncbi:MAG TPA: 16S rRNA (cytidine(1402)-2'-O)-methyltransferase [Pseudomonadales bacterium]|nr:16S rRNA (cytidine(1402)-2'-O)-methyltransferase [Pseudomonadales bacterium]